MSDRGIEVRFGTHIVPLGPWESQNVLNFEGACADVFFVTNFRAEYM